MSSNYSHSSNGNSLFEDVAGSAQSEAFDGRMLDLYFARVTNNKDPERQGRIKVQLPWQEEDGRRQESGWITRIVTDAGPTRMARNRIFGDDPPLPEVNSVVLVGFEAGNPAVGVNLGQPRFLEGAYGAPDLEKDKYRDWSHRREYQSGTRWCIDSEGNVEITVVGGLRLKVQGPIEVTSGTSTTILSPDTIVAALAVLQLIGVTTDKVSYPRPEQAARLRELAIDSQKFEPGFEDVKIQKVPDLE